MAAFRGDIVRAVGDQAYRLVLDHNAFAEFEILSGKFFADTEEQMRQGRLSAADSRLLVLATGLRHQPKMTKFEAGDLLAEFPTIIADLYIAALPTKEESDAAGN